MKKTQVTADNLRTRKQTGGSKITMVTTYDATFAALVDQAELDVILVGDSLGMVVQGNNNTLSVSVDDVIYHTRAVASGASRAHIVADMPFMSYQSSTEDAVRNAGRLLKEGGAQSVKLEGGAELVPAVTQMVRAGIPVMGHLGLTPQSVHTMGGFKIQGKTAEQASQILRDAKALEKSGIYALVLEGVPTELAKVVTAQLSIPTIGIGAGSECDGQVLVIYDLLGMNPDFQPKFVKKYRELGAEIVDALQEYSTEVRDGTFPAEAHSFHTKEKLFGPQGVVPKPDFVSDEDEPLYGVPV